ncbi:pyridoxamine 5-phosphate oxidase [Tropicibacter sp. R16_0]|uniref:HugZ family pyridoxamine 5'-phosphate oxidase n=1 Tax=Tropicibacter sp. R16_0 TaxID=2821102 RepID=UPI001ADBE331|nr:pyridoxamine 5-phosphate oxidase [Tropicibacter sp. R16_0]
MPSKDPFQPADAEARTLAKTLMDTATHAALAFVQPNSPAPSVTRVALARDEHGAPVSLISQLATHTAALAADPTCALLIGEPGEKGDPLTHPRLTLHCTARFLERGSDAHDALRAHYLSIRPKAKLYVDFADFRFVRFDISDGLLNGGFGKAYLLSPSDLI